ncbi:MAG TPA: FAD-binding oxidoreductase [Acidimicrobiales bacterium]|nr:FAD-binding oxidoreductase [Acidimicrobiales bacterium]
MVRTRSDLSREEIRVGLRGLVGASKVCIDDEQLRVASVDRFKKYMAANGIYDGPIPAAIVLVSSTAEVAAVLRFANEHTINVVPRTGMTATEGGLETIVEDSIVLDGSPMSTIVSIDPLNMMATAQCGVPLQVLEDAVRAVGLTTGNSPQSKPLAQMGGLTATRSIGQLSTMYGAIEDMVLGLEAVFPDGTVCRVKSVPRRAAGPDIRQIVIGSEGALCFITEVTVKLFRFEPENDVYRGFLVEDMETGLDVIREIVTAGFRPAVCRLYSEEDGRQGFGELTKGKCVMVFICQGARSLVAATVAAIDRVVAARTHEVMPGEPLVRWFDQLNWGSERIEGEKVTMRRERWLGYTTEISANWSDVADIYNSVMRRMRTEYPHIDDVTLLGAHSSHSYQTGTNLYFVYNYDVRCDPRQEIDKYHIPINAIIVEAALAHGGSMVHHHGIGKYRTDWTEEEHGSAYYLLAKLKETFDPNGVMNKGTIFRA